MASIIPHTRPLYCWKNIFRELRLQKQQFKRSLVTVQRGPIQKLDFPPNLPQRYWSQLPARLRPDKGKRKITIHEPPPSAAAVCKDPVAVVQSSQMPSLDPTGARQRLFDPLNRDGVKVGDILLATFKTGEPFSGVVMSIKLRGVDTSVLLRNHLTRIGTEMSIKVFSPLVQSMEVAQKAVKRKRRARLYYLRKPKHDVGSVEKVVDQYLRQRALLTGGKLGSQYGSRRPTVKGKKVLIDIPNDDEFDKCTGTPKIATEHASAIASSEILFPDSTRTELSVKRKTQDAASQDLEKSKAKPTLAPVR